VANKAKTIRIKTGTDRLINTDGEFISEVGNYKDVKLKVKLKYASMYLDNNDNYDALKGLGNFGAVWGYVLNNYHREKCIFYFSASIKEDISEVVKLSEGTIRSAIKSFCDSGLLLKIRNAEYMVNPSHFFMGNWEQRDKMIDVYDVKKNAIEMLDLNKSINETK
jgi:hypothetical protein